MEKPVISPGPTAVSTTVGKNRFDVPIYLLLLPNGTLRPCGKAAVATYRAKITLEYPTYHEELEAKQEATKFDEAHSVHFIDRDQLSEWRIRRCLISWNLDTKVPGLTTKLSRVEGKLVDASMETFQKLPPLIRKEIARRITMALGVE
jgi:hypothetical protein